MIIKSDLFLNSGVRLDFLYALGRIVFNKILRMHLHCSVTKI